VEMVALEDTQFGMHVRKQNTMEATIEVPKTAFLSRTEPTDFFYRAVCFGFVSRL
jgi:hypothetical protein